MTAVYSMGRGRRETGGGCAADDVRRWLVMQMGVRLVLRSCSWLLRPNVVCIHVDNHTLQASKVSILELLWCYILHNTQSAVCICHHC